MSPFEKIKKKIFQGVYLFILISFLSPVFFIIHKAFFSQSATHWPYLVDGPLFRSFLLSLFLVFLVNIFSLFIGVSCACLVSFYKVPFRKFLHITLILPIAIPSYVCAFIYLGSLDSYSFFGKWMSELFPLWTKVLYSPLGASICLSLCFFPYYYLLAHAGFQKQGKSQVELAQTMGKSRLQALISLALPSIRPWLWTAFIFVSFETLSDFGASYLFNIETLSLLIYKTWFNMFSFATACRVALLLLLFSMIIYLSSHKNKKEKLNFYHLERTKKIKNPLLAILAFSFLFLIACLATFFPVLRLCQWAIESFQVEFSARYFKLALHSFSFAAMTALLIILVSLFLNSFKKNTFQKKTNALLYYGYALPGAVLAAGVYLLSGIFQSFISYGFTMAMCLLSFGMLLRFLAVGKSSTEASINSMSKNSEELAETLLSSKWLRLKKFYYPACKKTLALAWFLVFIEVLKEMPIVLMTRPFGFHSFSTRIFDLISEGEWSRASIPSLGLLGLGFLGLFFVYSMNSTTAKASQ